jgi:hypothetical protein
VRVDAHQLDWVQIAELVEESHRLVVVPMDVVDGSGPPVR